MGGSEVCRKTGDGNELTGKEEKREAEEKIFGCSEKGYRKRWCKGGHWKQDAVDSGATRNYQRGMAIKVKKLFLDTQFLQS